uniref:Uncharacterized protein n=1 Tax=Hemiselmis andersenii TaxID=464988 RepID=A0A6T8PJ26_HEMAN|mmetsp:Transcript_48855/g.118598  ORF Transcript_48855/g.118598 Transcript_48855/m.118598 type:complete len:349 (+) Transcript_48855:47-1093(+)
MVYGSMGDHVGSVEEGGRVAAGEASERPGLSGARRKVIVGVGCLVAASALAVAGVVGGGASSREAVLVQRGAERLEMLSQTSARTDLVHPYGSMYPANPKFINSKGAPQQAVNTLPNHPFHNGHRPKMVLNDDFEHEPYGNHLPWEHAPAGALAKYDKRADKMKAYSYMVDRDGTVDRWDSDLREDEVDPTHVGEGTLQKMSPLPHPNPSVSDVAKALVNVQRQEIRKSFRDVLPKGAFHDSIVDSQSGRSLFVPDTTYGARQVHCPPGLVRCPDSTCVASMGYCPGCSVRPMPEYCAANAAKPSGWRASMIGCDGQTQVANCGMVSGQNLFLKGESVTGGVIEGGLA